MWSTTLYYLRQAHPLLSSHQQGNYSCTTSTTTKIRCLSVRTFFFYFICRDQTDHSGPIFDHCLSFVLTLLKWLSGETLIAVSSFLQIFNQLLVINSHDSCCGILLLKSRLLLKNAFSTSSFLIKILLTCACGVFSAASQGCKSLFHVSETLAKASICSCVSLYNWKKIQSF